MTWNPCLAYWIEHVGEENSAQNARNAGLNPGLWRGFGRDTWKCLCRKVPLRFHGGDQQKSMGSGAYNWSLSSSFCPCAGSIRRTHSC